MTNEVTQPQFWAEKTAKEVIERFPNVSVYTCAAGISPSGKLHFGNFRDLMTAYAVAKELEKLGKKTRVIYSFDNYDRLRKIPANVPESFEEYIGRPLTGVPDPAGIESSYAEAFQKELIKATDMMGMSIEYISQTEMYTKGTYADLIKQAMLKREQIAKTLLSFMSEKSKQERNLDEVAYSNEYYPISVYSEFTGKDATRITSYDGDYTITYTCIETGKESTINFKKTSIVKLAWKIDWPMRWLYEDVVFEPGGPDHSAPGSSYEVSSKIVQEVFDREPPAFVEYGFVGLQGQGTKMSGSKGNAVTPLDLLDVYQPSLFKWLYLRKNPKQHFSLSFGSEIYRQYDEFDRAITQIQSDNAQTIEQRQLEISFDGTREELPKSPFPFKQAVALGQIVQWDTKKVQEILYSLEQQYDIDSIEKRLPLARAWLEKYNADEVIRLLDGPNKDYFNTLSDVSKAHIAKLKEILESGVTDIRELEQAVYAIPKDDSLSQKENAPLQRAFFKDVYTLLIGKDTGPRLSTFLWAVDRPTVIRLLTI